MDTKIYYIKRYNTFQINYLCKEIFHQGFLNRTNSKLSEGVDHLEDEVVADSLELVPLQFCRSTSSGKNFRNNVLRFSLFHSSLLHHSSFIHQFSLFHSRPLLHLSSLIHGSLFGHFSCFSHGSLLFNLTPLSGEEISKRSKGSLLFISFLNIGLAISICRRFKFSNLNTDSLTSRFKDGVKGEESHGSKLVREAKEVELAMIFKSVFILFKVKLILNIWNLFQEFLHHVSKVKHIFNILRIHTQLLKLSLDHLKLSFFIQRFAKDLLKSVKFVSI